MILLAIETSSPRGSLALLSAEACLRESAFEEGLVHGREITARLEEMLRLEGLGPRALGAVSVSIGPGSYTGIRVGVTAAKSLGFALRIPVITESSLRVLAANLALEPSPDPRVVAPLLDARGGLYFGAFFEVLSGAPSPRGRGAASGIGDLDDEVRRLAPDAVATAGEMVSRRESLQAKEAWVLGEGASSFMEALNRSGRDASFRRLAPGLDAPRALALGLLTRRRALEASFDPEAVHALEPSYLRIPEAERKLVERESSCP